MNEFVIDWFEGFIYGQAIGDSPGLGTEFMTGEDIAKKWAKGGMSVNGNIPS